MSIFVGAKEAGEILGWDRRKVSTYYLRGILPSPVSVLSSGPVWFREQIEYFYLTREKKIPLYFYDGTHIFRYNYRHIYEQTDLDLHDIHASAQTHILWNKNDVEDLTSAIVGKSTLVRFISPGNISIFHDFGLLSDEIYEQYLEDFASSPLPVQLHKS
jgi:hypothetical protein